MLLFELGVDRLVMLTVIADQQPSHPRELDGEAAEVRELVLATASKPAVVRRAPVGEKHRTGREQMSAEKTAERRCHVPRAGGQIDHRSPRMLAHQLLEQHGHAWNGKTSVLIDDERVPRGYERTRKSGDHDGVVNVGEDAELDLVVDDERCGFDRVLTLDRHREAL